LDSIEKKLEEDENFEKLKLDDDHGLLDLISKYVGQ
jgi:hypothetical protein